MPRSIAIAAALFAIVLSACTPQQSDSNWAIDQQAVYCANTRAGGFVIGDPRAFSGVPLVGPAAVSAGRALEEEAACQVVRGLSPSEIGALKLAQGEAAKTGRSVASGPFTVTPSPQGAQCVPIRTVHRASGRELRAETLCRTRQGDYAPFGQS